MTTFRVVTLGCKVNQYESAYVHSRLQAAGWHPASSVGPCDVTVVNTCIVTQKASHQSRQAIHKAVRENPSGRVAVIGCYPEVFPDEIAAIPGICLIAGNADKGRVPDLILERPASGQRRIFHEAFRARQPFARMPVRVFPDRTRAFVKIQDGCECMCSYCIVPQARGPYRSLPSSEVLSLLEGLSLAGCMEVVLTGIHLGKYGVDLPSGENLIQLLDHIGRAALPLRIRLSSIEPQEIEDPLIQRVAAETWICRHFHVPLQSGDDETLTRMNRKYRAAEFGRLIEKIRSEVPLAAIGVDVMAGFPGESGTAHANTLALIRDLPVTYLHVFRYSRRPGTPAARFPGQLEPKVIGERASALRSLGREKRSVFYRSCLNREFQVLVENWKSDEGGLAQGTTDNYLNVIFPLNINNKNRLVNVRMDALEGERLRGNPL
jgi:threonylcarbamoyladenosine tRNA methylthiotransferase MtaB